ncbi:hypothetical protein [Rhodoplanes sp. Z2-YC6860]|uniref:hypothetical protein n=1 Tax=Rhodoplanes sp. Z2-YC6860 TaxID=674703 RepID=UPI00078DE2A0|nr:hypothetical protein [Rhodoplanes sp. Z2-YC6860]AMN42042.1 hypothetical protein RHPLAN_36100 [Rhodoplanes sp. Z2-YC6860]
MRAHRVVRSVRHFWRRRGALLWLAVSGPMLLVQGCAISPGPQAGADPSDAAARVPTSSYRSVTRGYESRRPVEPAPWRERNDSVAPEQKP